MFILPWFDYPPRSAFARRVLRRLSAPADRVLQWYRRNQALEELHGLDSRTLKDMGLHEGEIWWVADAFSRGVEYRREEHDRSHRPGLCKPRRHAHGLESACRAPRIPQGPR